MLHSTTNISASMSDIMFLITGSNQKVSEASKSLAFVLMGTQRGDGST
jgi:hypothetical protein